MIELFETAKMKVSDLVPHVKNPRKIKAEEKNKLLQRIQNYGMIGIPVVNFDGTILSGNQRCEVLMKSGLGETIIDVRKAIRELTEAELKEVMLIENSHAGEWDLDMLNTDFADYVDIASFGISLEELTADLNEKKDESIEPEMAIVAKMSEKYTAFVIVCSNEIDENFIAERLNLDKEKCYKSTAIGQSHVISSKKFIESWNSK
jgi:hypothetical protein